MEVGEGADRTSTLNASFFTTSSCHISLSDGFDLLPLMLSQMSASSRLQNQSCESMFPTKTDAIYWIYFQILVSSMARML